VSDKAKCNDFCYWNQNNRNVDSMNGNGTVITATTILSNPHITTTNTNDPSLVWGCIRNAASNGDSITWSKAMPRFQNHEDMTFDHLRCGLGAGEVVHSRAQEWVESAEFWSILAALGFLALLIEILYFGCKAIKGRRRSSISSIRSSISDADEVIEEFHDNMDVLREPLLSDSESHIREQDESSTKRDAEMAIEEVHDAIHGLQEPPLSQSSIIREHNESSSSSSSTKQDAEIVIEEVHDTKDYLQEPLLSESRIRVEHDDSNLEMPSPEEIIQAPIEIQDAHDSRLMERQNSKSWPSVILFLLNAILLYIILTSILSILEITYAKDLHLFALKVLTPACTPDTLCTDGNVDVDNPSLSHPSSSTDFRPFSYLIASDAQVNWYNGESRHIGKMNYPPPCTSSDSCGSCQNKLGKYTNAQMKRAMENLIRGHNYHALNISDRPVPKTLVMNGDLTAYFHKGQLDEYANLYHNIQGLEEYFPSLGNHDYDHASGASYNGDEWIAPRHCNAKHAIGYLKSAFCQKVPKFDAKKRVTRYDSKSLAYSWEEGPYHFVHLHYYPTYENAKLGIKNSLQWLEKDLNLATRMNLTSIIYVHSAGDLSRSTEKILLKNKVAAIFAGHLHRCFGRKCAGWATLQNWEVDQMVNKVRPAVHAEKCFLAKAALCDGSVTGTLAWNVFSLDDMDKNLTLPNVKLYNPLADLDRICRTEKYDTYINTTDNTLLCKKDIFIERHFPFRTMSNKAKGDSTHDKIISEKIPIFWSGSSSFETFILSNFYNDRFVLNFITSEEGHEGTRYIDAHKVPNAVYPFHETSDLDEVTIYI